MIKKIIKSILWGLHIDLTKNLQYDRQTLQIMKKVLKSDSNCVDIGCHKGEMLDLMIKYAPMGIHYGFEPIPEMYDNLKLKYQNERNKIFPYALSEEAGEATFQFVVNAPAYSGFKKRSYDRQDAEVKEIKVIKERLDAVIASNIKVDFIKIDVEGAELEVLKGATETIKRCKPIIVFEHGLGASDHYGTKPEDIYELLDSCSLKISTMKEWLKNKPVLDKNAFAQQFYNRYNYYFIAHP